MFDKRDLAHCDNLIRAIKKAKFELDGMEVLAFAEVMKWVNGLYGQIKADLEEQAAPKPPVAAIAKEMVSPVVEAPIPAVVAATASRAIKNSKK